MKLYITIGFFISLVWADADQLIPRLQQTQPAGNRIDQVHLIGLMVEFQEESNQPLAELTSGSGIFLTEINDDHLDRCDGILADPPPHDIQYFDDQLEALDNYYHTVSNGVVDISYEMLPTVYELPAFMWEYALSDTALGGLFVETIELARTELEAVYTENSLIVVFHAGIGQDFAIPFLDPTPYDLASAYIDPDLLSGQAPLFISGYEISNGILLPETQNHIYFDVIEEIFFGESDYCDYQIGLTGTFAFLMGYHLGLPPLFNTSSGDPGVGVFGLMDQGSNNGRGVMPAPPTAWTRVQLGWVEPIVLWDPEFIQIPNRGDDDTVYKIPISQSEYFLVEYANNWVTAEDDISDLRADLGSNNQLAHWFDVVLDEMEADQISVDDETDVILGFNSYDYGLPGTGLLIWHIIEPDPDSLSAGINNDPEHRHIHLEEADGAVDIGFETTALFVDPGNGWRWDMWYADNDAYFFANPAETLENPDDLLSFTDYTSPNTRSRSGAESLVQIKDIGDPGEFISFHFDRPDYLPVSHLGYSPEMIQIAGSKYSADDSTSSVFYSESGYLYMYDGTVQDSIEIDEEVIVLFNPACIPDTVMIPTDWFDSAHFSDNCTLYPDQMLIPRGYIMPDIPGLHNVDIFEIALGDLDGDGLDEMISWPDSDHTISAMNWGGTSVNGFPIYGDYQGVPLIANIDENVSPEIIVRNGNDIEILTADGQTLYRFASIRVDEPLRLIPFWEQQGMALVDGFRLLLFPLDIEHAYWMNPYSRPSNSSIVTGNHDGFEDGTSNVNPSQFYNYPNPVVDGSTTFRYYLGEGVSRVNIHIYDAAGYKVTDLIDDEITPNEYNEIQWNTSDLDPGLYLAEVKPNKGDSHLVKVVIIN